MTNQSRDSFDLFDLLMSILSETPILLQYNIFITHKNIHLKKIADNSCYLFIKQI